MERYKLFGWMFLAFCIGLLSMNVYRDFVEYAKFQFVTVDRIEAEQVVVELRLRTGNVLMIDLPLHLFDWYVEEGDRVGLVVEKRSLSYRSD
jgi:hypothetical protein